MRRTIIVLIVSTMLLWGSAALARRPPATRLDGDPDEYQAKVIHDEKCLKTWISYRRSGGQNITSRVASEPGIPEPGASQPRILEHGVFAELRSGDLGRLLWEVLFPGKKHRYSGEGR